MTQVETTAVSPGDTYQPHAPDIPEPIEEPKTTTRPDRLHSKDGQVIALSAVLDNDDIAPGQKLTLFIPADQVLEHGTITVNEDGEYVFVPDEGAVGTSIFAYHLLDEDGNFVTGGAAQIRVDNEMNITVSSATDTENYTAYASDGTPIDLSVSPGSHPVETLIERTIAGLEAKLPEGAYLDDYRTSVDSYTVTDNGDGTWTVRFDVEQFGIVKGPDGSVYGNYEETTSYEFTLVKHGSTTVPADLSEGTEIDLLPLLDVLPGQNGDTVLLSINGVEITATDQEVVLASGATVRFDSASGTLVYIPAEGQTENDRFEVELENSGYPRTRTIEIVNTSTPLVAKRDSAFIFQPDEDGLVTFTFGGQVFTVPAGYFTSGELSRLAGVNWDEAFDTGTFFDADGTFGENGTLALFHFLGGDNALTNKVLDLTFSNGTTSFTMRDYVEGNDTAFSSVSEAGQCFAAALRAGPWPTVTIDPLSNDTGHGSLTLTGVTVVTPDVDVEVTIVNNQIVISTPPGFAGDITLSYTVTDDTGAVSESFVDVTVSAFTEAQMIERNYAADRLAGVAGMPLDGLTIQRTETGDYRISVDGMDSFVVDGDSFLFGPDFIEQMILQFAISGSGQALQQLYGEEMHFDLDNPEEKQLYEMFITVAAELGMTEGPYEDHFEGLLNTDRVFAEMTRLLFDTDAGSAWVRDNIDEAVSALHVEPGFEALEGLSAADLLAELKRFLSGVPPVELRGPDGAELTTEQKDVIMANYLNQIGFLSTYGSATQGDAALNDCTEALLDYAAHVYAPDAAAALHDELIGDGTIELDFSILFNGLSLEEGKAALLAGDYEAFGLTEEEVIQRLADAFVELATAGLEIRNAATNPDQISGWWALIMNAVPPDATTAEIKAFIRDTVSDTIATRQQGDSPNSVFDDFYYSLEKVGKLEQHSKFKKASANFKSYNNILASDQHIDGKLPGPDAGSLLVILTTGLAGIIMDGGFSSNASAAEKLTATGWLSLLVWDSATQLDAFFGPVSESAFKTGSLKSLLDDLKSFRRTGPTTLSLADDLLEEVSDEAMDDVGKLLKDPAAQKMKSFRGALRTVGMLALAFGGGVLGTSLAIQASQHDDIALKATQAVTSAMWFGTSVGATISGAANISRSMGVTLSNNGTKIAGIAGKSAGILARATAFSYAVIGGIQGVRAQEKMRAVWNILMRAGGPDEEEGYYVKPEHHDLQPYDDWEAGLWGALSSLFGFPPITGFRPDNPSPWREDGIFGNLPSGSDIRLKTDIRQIGFVAHLGVPLYSWRYRDGDNTRFVGLMAQELLARPTLAHAVTTYQDGPRAGFFAVDYKKLGMQMQTEENYRAGLPVVIRTFARAA